MGSSEVKAALVKMFPNIPVEAESRRAEYAEHDRRLLNAMGKTRHTRLSELSCAIGIGEIGDMLDIIVSSNKVLAAGGHDWSSVDAKMTKLERKLRRKR